MIINMSKTKELVFYRPHPSRSHVLLVISSKLKSLGFLVLFSGILKL